MPSSILALDPTHFQGTAFRLVDEGYGDSEHLLNGGGGFRRPGRYHQGCAVIYCSVEARVALAETLPSAKRVGLLVRAKPIRKLLVEQEIFLRRVLDLCDARVRRKLEVTVAELTLDAYGPSGWRHENEKGRLARTQLLAEEARAAGFEALMVPSAALRRGVNLVIFPDLFEAGSRIGPPVPRDNYSI